MVAKEVTPCGREGLVSSAHGNKTCFDADVALHLGTRQASGTDGTAGCAAERNAFVKGRTNSWCTSPAKKASVMLGRVCRRALCSPPKCVGLVSCLWVVLVFFFFSKGWQQIGVNEEKG